MIRVASPESYDQGDDSSPAPLIKIKTYERRTVSTTTITTTVDEFGFSVRSPPSLLARCR